MQDEDNDQEEKSQNQPVALSMTEDEARRKYEQKMADSTRALTDAIKIEERDGKKYIAGFIPVPKGTEGPINSLFAVLKPKINKNVGEFIHDQTLGYLGKWERTAPLAKRGALISTGLFSGLLVGARPIMQLWQANRYRS